MELYTKFESRSSRAKAVAFHPTRPWVLVGLYSSTIQLWDYRMGWIIDRFEGHQGPVRGLDVHPTQQIFVSCGDDQMVRVWSLSDRRLLFSLEGHQDYVRTVFFHKELPWIVSSSDDQTIRIWDWQARKEIAVLTGHNHWVSCAVFHPTEDLIISSSLDCTVRAWDISGLKRRHCAAGVLSNGAPGAVGAFSGGFPGGLPAGFPSNSSGGFPQNSGGRPPLGFSAASNGLDDDFFGAEVVTKFVLEGHDRGVTWVACHPSQPLIVSSSDDRTLKVWRMSESRAWEIDTCRGHRDEVTSCAFDPFADVIVSCSTDETIRTWDLNKRTQIMTFERDKLTSESADRYWNIALHPTSNLMGSALDNGATVFKLSYERPAYIISPQLVFVGHDKLLRDGRGNSSSVSLAQPVCGQPLPPFAISYNPAENAILASYGVSDKKLDESFYVLYSLSGNGLSMSSGITKTQRGPARNSRFISRNRFCTLLSDGTMEFRDMNNSRTKELKPPIDCRSFEVTPLSGQLLLIGSKTVVLFDLQQRQILSKISAENVRRAVWSPSGNHVALLSKHDIIIATKHLEPVTKIFETIRVKNLAWDKYLPVVVYSTFSHLKYGLLNGDNGVLRTMEEITYVAEVSKSEVTLLTRRSSVEKVTIDPTEYRFKLALINRNFAEVARLIESSQLVGQSIIAYLQKRGYPEIALEFVQDAKSRLDLAVESGNLEIASQAAAQLQGSEFDDVLASAALEQGNHDLLEDVYQRQRDFDKLAFVYLETGNRSRLQRLEQLAMQRGDSSARFQTSLFLNSAETRIELLQQAGLAPLAYALAKSQGFSDEADQIREDSGVEESSIKITISDAANGLTAPSIVHETYKANWPVKKKDKVDIMSLAKLSINDKQSTSSSQAKLASSQVAYSLDEEEELDGDAWDLDDQLEEEDIDLIGAAEGGKQTPSELAGGASPPITESWVHNSTVPADHIAAGSFETAAQLLNRQIGVVRFEPLKARFFDVYSGSKLAMPGHDGLAPLPYFVSRGTDNRLPFIPGLDHLQPRLSEAFNQVKANQLELAVDSFREVLHTVVTLAVDTEGEEAEVRKVVETCKNYILAFSIELKRRALPKEDVKRNLELAAYFTKPKLRAAHAVLPLRTAAVQASNAKNYSLASHFAAEYLKVDSNSPAAKKMSANKAKWDSLKGLDPLDIDFDMFAEFDIDPKSLTPIYEGQPIVTDPLTKAKYHANHKGEVCMITGFTEVGASASGLRLKA